MTRDADYGSSGGNFTGVITMVAGCSLLGLRVYEARRVEKHSSCRKLYITRNRLSVMGFYRMSNLSNIIILQLFNILTSHSERPGSHDSNLKTKLQKVIHTPYPCPIPNSELQTN